jgi:hypothetical protein
MIHIQIATSLSEDGVGDLRWVLLDPSESAPSASSPAPEPGFAPTLPAEEAPEPAAEPAPPPAAPGARRGAVVLLVVAALASAGWVAWNVWHPSGASAPAAAKAPLR